MALLNLMRVNDETSSLVAPGLLGASFADATRSNHTIGC